MIGGDASAATPTEARPVDATDGGSDPATAPPPGPPTWRRASTSGPPARHSATIAYDANRQRVVLFGGWAAAGLGDTWEWDGTTWSERTLPDTPSKRRGHRMVQDLARNVVILYGGTRGDSPDTWSWDGVRWRPVTSATRPPSQQNLAMAYDSDRGVVVIFGGNHYPATGNAFMRDDTWEWNGSDWSQRSPASKPSARRGHAMTYDAARKRVVMFGGRGSNTLRDTGEYDGTTWTEREPINVPPPRGGACMAYDPRRKLVVMYGGSANDKTSAQTWHWNGDDWSLGPGGPPALRSCAMTWDPARRAIVLFGGSFDGAASAASSSGETWVYE